LEEELQGTIS